jgi:hypothetical protein
MCCGVTIARDVDREAQRQWRIEDKWKHGSLTWDVRREFVGCLRYKIKMSKIKYKIQICSR